MSEAGTLISNSGKITREESAQMPTPPGTITHRPVPHHEVVEALVETLSFRHIGVVGEEYTVSGDGMRMIAVLDLEAAFEACRFAIGLRNSHDKSFRLSCTVGVRVPGFILCGIATARTALAEPERKHFANLQLHIRGVPKCSSSGVAGSQILWPPFEPWRRTRRSS
jgi:hypothetical protein